MAPHRHIPRRSMAPTAVACAGFALLCASMPFFITKNQSESLYSKEGALSSGAIRRGVYVNSGSKDVGVDKEWDFKNHARKQQ
mmetsp:Transcript_9855/g.14670  ORF Transcript_9855/g.14670 Transcript_9855/m.14670 type:complete len:83 (+) Transcript_9855:28-276(+)